ncbi:hypothetical protein G6O67_001450 [Ophiocordyceps sinensis]|uniref:Uncharacterized protein n=2 Tax=Ophiocordyceps sinensis TaxID=72228 RepID=A0A8H4PXK6_9HYPO|nr:hypothetical protein OCS_03941 [Ophiocordyceps sinensis CO18]KAF4512287.1 hypothetical protein G6O67_001450 [Ophiocordyceps sinensis]
MLSKRTIADEKRLESFLLEDPVREIMDKLKDTGELSLHQWIQRKVSLARQLRLEKDWQVIQTFHGLIAVQISSLLSLPDKKTSIEKWIREIEERKPLITASLERYTSRDRSRRDDPRGPDRRRGGQKSLPTRRWHRL